MTQLDRRQEAPLPPGTPVEVWVRYDEAWVGGFTVADCRPGGYQVRRNVDGIVLPVELSGDAVRPASTQPGSFRL